VIYNIVKKLYFNINITIKSGKTFKKIVNYHAISHEIFMSQKNWISTSKTAFLSRVEIYPGHAMHLFIL